MIKIPKIPSESKQITSRRIAELTSREHHNILKSIDQLNGIYELNDLQKIEEQVYIDKRGKTQREFLLNEKQSIALALGYSAEMRVLVVEEWHKLKSGKYEITSQIPSNFSEALQLAADQAKQIEINAPKVELHDQIMDTAGLTDFDSMAKECGMNRAQIWPILRKREYIYQKFPLPIAEYEKIGYFVVKKVDFGNGHSGDQTFFTPAGVEYFAPKLPRWFIEDGYTLPTQIQLF